MKAKEGNVMFVVVSSTSRNYGYSIQAPADVTWAKGPGKTFGWYRRKRDAQRRCDELNEGEVERTTDDD